MSVNTQARELFAPHSIESSCGRKIAVWSRIPAQGARAAIVIAPGFARRMDHFAPMALYLARNGFATYRFDFLDHVGLSEGEMFHFTLGSALDSLARTIEFSSREQGVEAVGVFATSISARIAYELLKECPRLSYVVSAVGVVNLRQTMALAFEDDYLSRPVADAPKYVEFERKKIDALNFYQDSRRRPWLTLDGTIEALAHAPQPIVNFTAADDRWVDENEVQEAFRRGNGGSRRILSLARSGHDFGRNAAVARTFLRRATEEASELADLRLRAVEEPSFEELADVQIQERRLQRGALPRVTTERLAAIAAAEISQHSEELGR
jgi:acyl transferase